MMHRIKHVISLIMAMFLLASGTVLAQKYPSKSVRIVVPNAPGGPSDLVARVLAQKLSEAWGQAVVVDNRPGAGTNLGTEAVVKSAPDGYTLLLVGSTISVNRSLYTNIPFDPITDLAPISMVASTPTVLIVPPNFPANSVAELVQLAKRQPGRLNFASTGVGFTSHLEGEMLNMQAGTKITHIPYRSASQVYTALMTNEVAFYFDGPHVLTTHVRAGKLKALAVTGKTRSSIAPDLPTMVEAGFPEFVVVAWFGTFAPAGTHHDIVSLINAELGRALREPDVQQALNSAGYAPVGTTPEQLASQLKNDVKRWADLIKATGIKAQ